MNVVSPKAGRVVLLKALLATPVQGELLMGWFAHYSLGITFAALLLSTFGLKGAQSPSLLPVLVIALATASLIFAGR
jgi:hypothetical protein